MATYTKGRRGYYTLSGSTATVLALPGDVFVGTVEKGRWPHGLSWAARGADGTLLGFGSTRKGTVEVLVDRHHGRGG